MMFITPMPPTRSAIAAMPASMTVSVLSTDVAASRIDCWVAIEKSAFLGFETWCALSSSRFASWYAAESRPAERALT